MRIIVAAAAVVTPLDSTVQGKMITVNSQRKAPVPQLHHDIIRSRRDITERAGAFRYRPARRVGG